MSRFIGGKAPAGYTGTGPANHPIAAKPCTFDRHHCSHQQGVRPRGPIKANLVNQHLRVVDVDPLPPNQFAQKELNNSMLSLN
jgi:hypothetical protein